MRALAHDSTIETRAYDFVLKANQLQQKAKRPVRNDIAIDEETYLNHSKKSTFVKNEKTLSDVMANIIRNNVLKDVGKAVDVYCDAYVSPEKQNKINAQYSARKVKEYSS